MAVYPFADPVSQAEPDHYMIPYHPYCEGHTNGSDSQTLAYIKGNTSYDQERREKFITRVADWLNHCCEDYCRQKPCAPSDLVIAIAPATSNPSGFMHEAVGRLLSQVPAITDGRKMLIRTVTIPKQCETPGQRNPEVHEGTIAIDIQGINPGPSNVQGTNPIYVQGRLDVQGPNPISVHGMLSINPIRVEGKLTTTPTNAQRTLTASCTTSASGDHPSYHSPQGPSQLLSMALSNPSHQVSRKSCQRPRSSSSQSLHGQDCVYPG